jgi:hypothetical protein
MLYIFYPGLIFPPLRHAQGLRNANTLVARPEGSKFLSCDMFSPPLDMLGGLTLPTYGSLDLRIISSF